MTQNETQTETQSQLILKDVRPLWAVCPVCKKERRVRENGEMCQHRYYDVAAGEMWYCDGSYGRPGNVTVWSHNRKDSGNRRGSYVRSRENSV